MATTVQELLTVREMAALFRANEKTIRRWTKAGLLGTPVKIGKAVLFPRDTVERLLRGEKA